jgi:hypothetical protein
LIITVIPIYLLIWLSYQLISTNVLSESYIVFHGLSLPTATGFLVLIFTLISIIELISVVSSSSNSPSE